jgi:hypothetical protein
MLHDFVLTETIFLVMETNFVATEHDFAVTESNFALTENSFVFNCFAEIIVGLGKTEKNIKLIYTDIMVKAKIKKYNVAHDE